MLYQKYRPKTLEEVVGNEKVVATLEKMAEQDNIPHAILFSGETGCGKTTLARIVANIVGAVGSDFSEYNSADFTGVDTIRDIRQKINYAPMYGQARVILLDEVHMLSSAGQNALLKLLEDTLDHVYFILATTDPQKLLKTIIGRCSVFEVKPLQYKEMLKLLKRIMRAEKKVAPKEVIEQIISTSEGHPRNAIQLLEQVLSETDTEKQLELAKQSLEQENESIELARVLLQNKGNWKQVTNILNGLKGTDPEKIRRVILGYMSTVLLKSDNMRAAMIIEEFSDNFWNSGFAGLVLACYSVVKD